MVDIATSNYSSRNGQRVIWVAIHTTEGIMDARDLGYYWQRINSASSHAGCDNAKTVTYVDPVYASWTLLNGNSRSVNMEICGWARWTRDEWLGPQRGRLVQAANWARQMCDRFGIPKRHIGATGVARGEAGIIGHVDYTNGAKDGTHWDPGPGFPWDVFINLVNGSSGPGGGGGAGTGGDDFLMGLEQWKQDRIFDRILAMSRGVAGQNFDGEFVKFEDERHAKLEAKVDALAESLNKILEKLGVDPKPEPQPEPESVYHTVVKGDTLYSLANKYETTVARIKELSAISSDTLSIGQRLRVK
jgi:hypothetical protein